MVVRVVEYEECALVEFDDGSIVIMTSNDIVTL